MSWSWPCTGRRDTGARPQPSREPPPRRHKFPIWRSTRSALPRANPSIGGSYACVHAVAERCDNSRGPVVELKAVPGEAAGMIRELSGTSGTSSPSTTHPRSRSPLAAPACCLGLLTWADDTRSAQTWSHGLESDCLLALTCTGRLAGQTWGVCEARNPARRQRSSRSEGSPPRKAPEPAGTGRRAAHHRLEP